MLFALQTRPISSLDFNHQQGEEGLFFGVDYYYKVEFDFLS